MFSLSVPPHLYHDLCRKPAAESDTAFLDFYNQIAAEDIYDTDFTADVKAQVFEVLFDFLIAADFS